jgi:hypothetical protein
LSATGIGLNRTKIDTQEAPLYFFLSANMDSSESSFPEEFDVEQVDPLQPTTVYEDSDKDLSVDDPLLEQAENQDWSPHNSFLADSPYFNAFVENDTNSLSVLIETLQDISTRTKTFSKCGALMAESTRRLASACRLERENDFTEDMSELERAQREAKLSKERRRALGNEMADLLQLLGEVSLRFFICFPTSMVPGLT